MRNNRKIIAWVLVLACLFSLVGCKKKPEPTETTPVQTTAPAETQTPEVPEDITVETADGLTPVTVEATEAGIVLTSQNPAGKMDAIRLTKELDTQFGRYYEMVFTFTSNVSGKVRFTSEGAAYYESNEFDVVEGENEITVRFAAGKAGTASLELGALDQFELVVTSVTCEELTSDLSPYFLDVADKASGSMETNGDGHLTAKFKADEGWRVKLAVDRSLVAGKTYETTFVFTKEGGQPQNVTYTVYDGAATILGAKTKWVDDVCVATFYLTANETITKGTCLELGMLSSGQEVSMTVTYVDFVEVDAKKLAQLQASNPFPGVSAWTEGALAPASAEQSAEGLRFVNTNDPTDWWKVKLEMDLKGEKDHYYRVTFVFDSDAEGKIKFINDGASYVTANEYTVKKGTNTFTIDLKHGGNSYSCLELGGLGKCELNFTEIKVEEIDKPQSTQKPGQSTSKRFGSFRVWTDGSVQSLKRTDTAKDLTLVSANEPTDWWKVKLEKDLTGTAGKCYEVTYKFTSDAAGRIKFVNDDAAYFTNNEYDVVVGENTFTVQFKYGGKPYSCLELGGLGAFKLVLTDYTVKEIEEPEITTNGFENYKGWTEGSMTPLTREDTETSMILTSTNAATDWWKVKLENNFALEPGKTYEAVYTFTSDATGDIKFGTNEKVTCHTSDIHYVTVGENQFKVTFTAQDGAYTCLELGGLGPFRLEFTSITLTETTVPEVHTHSFVNGLCDCGADNGFSGVTTWTEGSLTALVREDTENTMTLTSTNGAADWWKMKLEWPLTVTEGKTYDATFVFDSDVSGTIKYSVNSAAYLTSNEYNVQAGSNTFTVRFTAGSENYSCLELGGLGAFKLTFTGLSLTEVAEEHTHSFVNGRCDCGETNGFAGVSTWTEGSLTALVREDTENTMTLISTNGAADWWKMKLEWPLTVTEGKTYDATFVFDSDVSGTIKYSVNSAAYLTSNEYNVQAGSNTFTVRFTAGAENYSCLELGGLGAFKLTFTGISLTEVAEGHTHSFVNGLCDCGETNGFAGVTTWTEGSLTALVREDTENTMTLVSTNGAADWWKMKLEWPLSIEEGKTYEVTFCFTSDVSGTIKYSVNGASYLTSNEYSVQAGSNTFTIRFTAGAENYSCLELGGLGAFRLTFTGLGFQEVE